MYDYLIVGSGLYGATFARLAKDSGKTVLVIDEAQDMDNHEFMLVKAFMKK